MATPTTELEFTRIWKGIGKKIDMGKVARRKTKASQREAFRQQLDSFPLPAKNLKRMKDANIDRLLSTALISREDFLKIRIRKIRQKQKKEVSLTPLEKKRLREFEDLKRLKKGIKKARLVKGKQTTIAIRREELVTQGLEKRDLKIKKAVPVKKKGRGRKPFKAKKAISLFSKKKLVQGKTKSFKAFGSVSTERKSFWVIEANLKTGKIRLRNKATGQFAKSIDGFAD